MSESKRYPECTTTEIMNTVAKMTRGSATFVQAPRVETEDIEEFYENRRKEENEFLEKLEREITFKKVRYDYLHENVKSICYDSKLYDPKGIAHFNDVEARLNDIFGTEQIHLQNPERSEEWLRIYKGWLGDQEKRRLEKIIRKGFEYEQKVRWREKCNRIIEEVEATTLRRRVRPKYPVEEKIEIVEHVEEPHTDLQSSKLAHNIVTSTDEKMIPRLALNGLSVQQLYKRADDLVDTDSLFPSRRLTIKNAWSDEENTKPEEFVDTKDAVEEIQEISEKSSETNEPVEDSSKKKPKKKYGFLQKIIKKIAPSFYKDDEVLNDDTDSLFN